MAQLVVRLPELRPYLHLGGLLRLGQLMNEIRLRAGSHSGALRRTAAVAETDKEAMRVTHFSVVLNWFEELKRLVPPK